MELKLSKELVDSIEKIAREKELNRKDTIDLAINLYIKRVNLERKALQEEMKAWERASDKDFANFCKKHNL